MAWHRRLCLNPGRLRAGPYVYVPVFCATMCPRRITKTGCSVAWISLSTLPRTATISAATCSRSEEHTSELQSRRDLVCRLLLEKKNHPTVADAPNGGDVAPGLHRLGRVAALASSTDRVVRLARRPGSLLVLARPQWHFDLAPSV